jgi:hypothetical protein
MNTRLIQIGLVLILTAGMAGCDSGGIVGQKEPQTRGEKPLEPWVGKYNLALAAGEEIQRDIDVWWDVSTDRIREIRQWPAQSNCGVDTLEIISIESGGRIDARDTVRTVTPEKDTLQFAFEEHEGSINGRLVKTPGKWTDPPRYPGGEGGFIRGDSVSVDILEYLGCK